MTTNVPTHDHLLEGLRRDYEAKFAQSRLAHGRAADVFVDGINHDARLFAPYPFRIASSSGAYITDIDNNRLLDYWQGHYTNILGHNPAVVREALKRELARGQGLQTGLPDERATEFAELLARATGAERVRLTTSGTLATMYAIMLSRAYTERKLVVKVGGGWHGANPLALKGVNNVECGFEKVDSAGVPESTEAEIIVTRFNDVDNLRKLFRSLGDRIACFIFEPCMGGAGFIPASSEFMRAARELTEKYGAMLILDEIITGFRYCASGVQKLYNVKPDLSTFGKIIGGGMPLVAVVGRADVLGMAGKKSPRRVWFNGGTFSVHPLSVVAGKTILDHLIQHEAEIYPALAAKGAQLRAGIEKAFADRDVLARCTGTSEDVVRGGSLATIYFPRRNDHCPTCADDLLDPRCCDAILREQALKLGLLLQNVNVVHGLGALSLEHSDADLAHTFEACDAFAQRLLAGR